MNRHPQGVPAAVPEELKKAQGKRVRCLGMYDPHGVDRGEEGTVQFVDDLGTLHVKWDNGRSLGLVYDVDRYRILD